MSPAGEIARFGGCRPVAHTKNPRSVDSLSTKIVEQDFTFVVLTHHTYRQHSCAKISKIVHGISRAARISLGTTMAQNQYRRFAGNARNFTRYKLDPTRNRPLRRLFWRGNEATMSSRRVRSTNASAWRAPGRAFTLELNLFFFRFTLNKSPHVRSEHAYLRPVAKYHSVSEPGNPRGNLRVVVCTPEFGNLHDIARPGLPLAHDSAPEILFLVHLQRNRAHPYIHGWRSFR